MYLEIVTPEATLFTGDVESVSVPGVPRYQRQELPKASGVK